MDKQAIAEAWSANISALLANNDYISQDNHLRALGILSLHISETPELITNDLVRIIAGTSNISMRSFANLFASAFKHNSRIIVSDIFSIIFIS